MALAGEVTNPQLLETKDITITSDGASIEAYFARPRQPGNYPGIIVIHEAFGPVEHISDVARRFANLGYMTIAPNLYSRVGAPGSDMAAVMPKMFGLSDAQAVRDLEAAAAYLRAQDGATGKVGCVGFCSGGRHTLLFACSSDKVDAAIPCWGGFITSATPNDKTTPERPTPVIELVDNLHCPLYGVYGEQDQNPSPADADELLLRGRRAGKKINVEVFPGVGHAFFADYRPSYNEKASFDLWPKMVAFFAANLK